MSDQASRAAADRPSPRPVVLHETGPEVRDRRPSPWRPHPAVAAGLVLLAVTFLLNLTPPVLVGIGVGTVLGIQTTVAVDRGRRIAEDLVRPPSVGQLACAVADGLRTAGLSTRGAEAVRTTTDAFGEEHCELEGVEPAVGSTFHASLEELLAPLDAPTHLLPRWVLHPPVDNAHGVRVALGRLRPDAVAWHSVPAAMSTSDASAQAFARAWAQWVGGGPALAASTPQGRRILSETSARHRGTEGTLAP